MNKKKKETKIGKYVCSMYANVFGKHSRAHTNTHTPTNSKYLGVWTTFHSLTCKWYLISYFRSLFHRFYLDLRCEMWELFSSMIFIFHVTTKELLLYMSKLWKYLQYLNIKCINNHRIWIPFSHWTTDRAAQSPIPLPWHM